MAEYHHCSDCIHCEDNRHKNGEKYLCKADPALATPSLIEKSNVKWPTCIEIRFTEQKGNIECSTYAMNPKLAKGTDE